MTEDELNALVVATLPSPDLLKPVPMTEIDIEGVPITLTTVGIRPGMFEGLYPPDPAYIATAKWKGPLHLGLSLKGHELNEGTASSAVGCDDPAVAAALMTPTITRLLSEFNAASRLEADDAKIVLHMRSNQPQNFPDPRLGPEGVAAEVFTLAALVAAVDLTRKTLPDPAAIAAHCASARQFVRGSGFELRRDPATVHGGAAGSELTLGVSRTGRDAYAIEGTVRFDAPLPHGLHVTSTREASILGRLWSSVTGGDIEVGDAAFDRAFFIKADDPAGAVALLGAETRADLLALLALCRRVQLGGATLHVGPSPLLAEQPEQFAQAATRLASIVRRLTTPAQAGVYR